MVNVQLTAGVRASLLILKRRYKVGSMAEALEKFLFEHDENVALKGRQIAAIESDTAEDETSQDEQ